VTHQKDNGAGNELERNTDSSPSEDETPFQRFEDFARRVISVPKSEIEQREREYQENRVRPKKASGPD
jgi:hypothetical protein